MKTKTNLNVKTATELKQKTILLYTGAGIAFAGIAGVVLFFYLNMGHQEEAMAAPVTLQNASEYLFFQSNETFTDVTGGTLVSSNPGHDERFNNRSIGFTFKYCGIDYTTLSISANGFIAMGNSVSNSTSPISSGSGSNNVISALGGDLGVKTGSEIRTQLTGSAPNRVLTIQWKGFTYNGTTGDTYNFQIKLYETSSIIQFVYGNFVKNGTTRNLQVGIRGASNADYHNRTTTTDWSATAKGTQNSATCRLRQSGPTVLPATGLVFTFKPYAFWLEDFVLSDGATTDNGSTAWSTSYTGSGTFSVQNQVFRAERTESEGVWTSEIIDISSANYAEINLDIAGLTSNFNIPYWGLYSDPDYIKCYYIIDGGPDEILFYEHQSSGFNQPNSSILSKVIKGNTVQIKIKILTTVSYFLGYEYYDYYVINNLSVSEVKTFYSCANGNWNSGNSWSLDDFSGPQTPVGNDPQGNPIIPSNKEGAIIGNNNTINLTSSAQAAFLEVHSPGRLNLNSRTLSLQRGGGVIVENGGSILGTANSAILIENATSTDFYIDASSGVDVDKLSLNSGSFLTFTGSGSLSLNDDLEINVDGATVDLNIPATIDGDIISLGNNNLLKTSSNLTWSGSNWSNEVGLTFDGDGDQTLNINSAKTFGDVTINKSSGRLLLTNSVSISGSMTFTSGVVEPATANMVIFNSGATASGSSTSSYVDGPVRKYGNQDFLFPVENGAYYAPIEISAMLNGASDTQFTARYFDEPGLNLLNILPGFSHVSGKEYWDLHRTYDAGNNAQCYVKLHFMDQERSEILDIYDLIVAHYNGTSWESLGGASITANSVLTSNRVTTFSPFTLGSSSGSNPLPVELKDFSAKYLEEKVNINWTTVSELNNDYFTIEHSTDGLNYSEIGTVQGHGTTNQEQKYSFTHVDYHAGINYYRLKQTDFDGTNETFRPVSVNIESSATNAVKIYPNPLVSNNLKLRIDSPEEGNIEIYDQNGRKVFSKELDGFNREEELNLPTGLHSGIYIVNVKTASLQQSFKLIKR